VTRLTIPQPSEPVEAGALSEMHLRAVARFYAADLIMELRLSDEICLKKALGGGHGRSNLAVIEEWVLQELHRQPQSLDDLFSTLECLVAVGRYEYPEDVVH